MNSNQLSAHGISINHAIKLDMAKEIVNKTGVKPTVKFRICKY